MLLVLSVVSFFFLSCNSDKVDINGTWFITDMSFQGKPTYPKTEANVVLGVLKGVVDHEYVSFRIVDSSLVLPGFNTEKLITDFAYRNKKLIINTNTEDPQLELTNLIFGGVYDIEYSTSENTLKLTSDKTTIQLIHQDEVLSRNVDNLFDSF